MLSRATLYNKIKPAAGKLQAIGNTTRLSILYILVREPMEFNRLSIKLKIPASLLSHHLKRLTESGWLTKTKVGKSVTYYVADDSAKAMGLVLRKFLSPQSESN